MSVARASAFFDMGRQSPTFERKAMVGSGLMYEVSRRYSNVIEKGQGLM